MLALFTFVIRDSGQWGTFAFAAILSIGAWWLGGFARRSSAPRDLPIWMFAGSVPIFALLSLALSTNGAAYAAGLLLALLLPPAVVAYTRSRGQGRALGGN